MPVKALTAPGDTAGKNILKSGTDYDTVHDATAGAIMRATNTFTGHTTLGGNYFTRRGILVYDFRAAPASLQGIRVMRAQLIVNDVVETAAQTGGDKVRVAWLFNPETFGDFHLNDYNKARYDTTTYTSAQQLNNGLDGEIISLDNRNLLNQLQRAISKKTFLHLVIRNELDYQDTTPTGNNRVFFDRPNADDNPMQLRVFYRIVNNRRNPGGRGAGGVASSGFGGVSMFSGTNSGFSN